MAVLVLLAEQLVPEYLQLSTAALANNNELLVKGDQHQ